MKAVILAAGKGERLRPLTETKPKAMLSICNKPIIDYQIEALQAKGIDEIAVVVNYLEDEIRKHLDGKVTFFRDDKISGTASAVNCARNFIDDDFILAYGDIFTDNNLKKIVDTPNSMAATQVADCSKYGAITHDHGLLSGLREKSEYGPGLVNAGFYHFDDKLFDSIEVTEKSERGEYELTDSIMILNKKTPVRVVNLEGYWNDIGYPWNYLDSNMFMLQKLGGLSIGENTEIDKSAIIRGPCIIGDDCTIRNCVVENSVLGNNCKVGDYSIVKRSVFMNNSNAPHQNYVGDSIVCDDCNLGAGTKTANLRFDEKNVRMLINGKMVDSGKRKLGAVIGSGSKTAINVSLNPGTIVGRGSRIFNAARETSSLK